jgi:hypothetical protein
MFLRNIIQAATAGVATAFILDFQLIQHNSISAAHPGSNEDGLLRAVPGTGAAFHAGITVIDETSLMMKRKNLLWAYLEAHPTTVALALIEFKGNYIFKIPVFHNQPSRELLKLLLFYPHRLSRFAVYHRKYPPISTTRPNPADPIINGRA